MYFIIKTINLVGQKINIEETEKFITSFPEIEILMDFYPYWDKIYYLSLTVLRKFKLLSLIDQNIKNNLVKLEKLLHNEELILNFGDQKPSFLFTTTGDGRTPTTTTTVTVSSIYEPNGSYPQINNFPRFDIHKINNKRFIYNKNLIHRYEARKRFR